MYNIMYLGIKPVGERCFQELINHDRKNIKLCVVVSNENANTVWWGTNGIWRYASENKVPFISSQERNLAKIAKYIKVYDVKCLKSNGYGWILPSGILELVSGCAFNLHLAPLPAYKGNYTFNHAILNGEKQYGVTLHYMTERVDEGKYVFMPLFDVREDETAYSLYKKSLQLGVECFLRLLNKMEDDETIEGLPMAGEGRFYSRKNMDELRKIYDINNSEEVDKKSRAFYFPPFKSAFYEDKCGKKYYILPDVKDV